MPSRKLQIVDSITKQADWNQTDETQKDFIKNRPFYTGEVEQIITEVLPQTTWNSTSGNALTLSEPLIEGKTYTVTCDGVAYECIARNYEGYLMLGNNAIYEYDGDDTTDTGEPFAMEAEVNNTGLGVYTTEEKDFTFSISYSETRQHIQKLPMKYLPEGYPWKEEGTLTNIIPETTIEMTAGNPALDPFSIEFVDGKTYTVVWDGVTYKCVAYIAPGPGTPSIGNGQIANAEGGNGEPFFCTVYDGQVMLFASEDGSHTISISTETNVIHPLANEYLEFMQSKTETLIPSQDIRFHNMSYVGWVATDMNPAVYNIIEGDTYIVTLDDVSYEVVAKYVQDYDSSILLLGNPNVMSSSWVDTGEPFCFAPIFWIGGQYGLLVSYEFVSGHSSDDPTLEIIHKVTPGIKESLLNESLKKRILPPGNVNQFVRVQSDGNWGVADVIDSTLSVENDAADAKATGDAITSIHTTFQNMMDKVPFIDQVTGHKYIASMRNGNLVTYPAVKSIKVTTKPNKTEYVYGEYFDPTGMVVTATCYDGSTKEVTDYTYYVEDDENRKYFTDRGAVNRRVRVVYEEAGTIHKYLFYVDAHSNDIATTLIDFEYTDNNDGTYTITGWKGTYNGEASTEIIIPNHASIII